MSQDALISRDLVVNWMQGLQDRICRGLLELEREAQNAGVAFREDRWEREGGGGGRSRVLAEGRIFEKAGVNFSEVHGEMDPRFAAELPGEGTSFFATGVSLVIHPRNPYVPTCHANFRYLEKGEICWFGGGADLTPYYYEQEDRDEFHAVWKRVCDAHPGVADYEHFSKWCDRYFYLPHRKERRGVGGIFFDYLKCPRDDQPALARHFAFVKDAGEAFCAAYTPIVRRRYTQAYGPSQREWQEIRRGRYVEFNLVYDRGTVFGLKTKGRTESILMSLPPHVQWRYDHEPEPASPEAQLLAQLRREPPAADENDRSGSSQ